MICIVMAGGRSSRLNRIEKSMLIICNKPMIERVFNTACKITDKVFVAVSPHTVRTKRWCLKNDVELIETTGKDYVYDLQLLLKMFKRSVLVLPADIPFITDKILLNFLNKTKKISADVITLLVDKSKFPNELRALTKEPVGISFFKGTGSKWSNIIMSDFPELLDIDTLSELRYARRLCNEISRRILSN